MRLAILAIALLPLATTTAASAELLRGRCHMDVCTWFSIEERGIVASNERGALFSARIRNWSSEHPGGSYDKPARRRDDGEGVGYFFCSRSFPAVLVQDGGWTAYAIDPDLPSGAFWSAAENYLGVCHGVKPATPARTPSPCCRSVLEPSRSRTSTTKSRWRAPRRSSSRRRPRPAAERIPHGPFGATATSATIASKRYASPMRLTRTVSIQV